MILLLLCGRRHLLAKCIKERIFFSPVCRETNFASRWKAVILVVLSTDDDDDEVVKRSIGRAGERAVIPLEAGDLFSRGREN